ncbi:hypothetical protein AX16_008088 [Volvariella volvacea WC 439]|nr:hypothetical protein AX16_008088 [Volvariella volvacea WC 439]
MAKNPAEIAHGPMMIGTILNVCLYGITVTQTYLYYVGKKRDKWPIQAFVYLLFVADTVQTVFTVVSVYDSVILHFGDFEHLETGDWIFATDPALTGMIGGMVQGFFAWRVHVLTGNIFLYVTILLCSAASFFMGIATAIAIGIVPQFVEFQKFQVVVIIWLVSASFADMLITATLVMHLRTHRTGFSKTDHHIDRIIRMTVQTGLLTAIWAFVDLMVYLLDPTGTHLIFNFPLSKLYTNSFMSSLNSRNGWKYSEDEGMHNSIKSSEIRRPDHVLHLSSRPEVFVHVESHEMRDTASADKPGTLSDGPRQWSSDRKNNGDDALSAAV